MEMLMLMLPLCSIAGIIVLASSRFWGIIGHTRTNIFAIMINMLSETILTQPSIKIYLTQPGEPILTLHSGAQADVLPTGSFGKDPWVFLGCYVKWSLWHLLFGNSHSRAIYCQWKFPGDTYWSFTVITEPWHNNLWGRRDMCCQRWKKSNLQLNIEHQKHPGGDL